MSASDSIREARNRLEHARTYGVYAAVVAAERELVRAIERENGVAEPKAEKKAEPKAEKKKLSADEVRKLREEHPEWFGGG